MPSCSTNTVRNPPKKSVAKLVTTMSSLRVRKRANTRILLGDAYVEVVKDSEILPPPRPLPNASDYDTERLSNTQTVLCETKAANCRLPACMLLHYIKMPALAC
jgi:hypothetical protein